LNTVPLGVNDSDWVCCEKAVPTPAAIIPQMIVVMSSVFFMVVFFYFLLRLDVQLMRLYQDWKINARIILIFS
jgi:hypothetical protein